MTTTDEDVALSDACWAGHTPTKVSAPTVPPVGMDAASTRRDYDRALRMVHDLAIAVLDAESAENPSSRETTKLAVLIDIDRVGKEVADYARQLNGPKRNIRRKRRGNRPYVQTS